VATTEQAVVHSAEQAAAVTLAAALLAALVAAVVTGRGATAGRFARRLITAGFLRATARFATLIAAAGRFTRLAAAVAAAVVQAQHAIQELETVALAAQAYADYKRSKNHVPFHRATSPLLELRIAWHPLRPTTHSTSPPSACDGRSGDH
jgi:hypothetical protein